MNFDTHHQQLILNTAKQAIDHGLKYQQSLQVELDAFPERLKKLGASFVTLNLDTTLRGCIGSLEAHHPLIIDIAENAHSAAFADPRFTPLSANEFLNIEIEVSILSKPVAFPVENEADLLAKLQPKVDGLILVDQGRHSTFLPSVWAQLPSPKEFVRYLKNKAGLPSDYWSETIHFYRYTTEKIR